MNRKIKLTCSITAVVTAVILSILTVPSYGGVMILSTLILIALGGLIISLPIAAVTIATWPNQIKKKSFGETFIIGCGVSSLVVISGYLFKWWNHFQ